MSHVGIDGVRYNSSSLDTSDTSATLQMNEGFHGVICNRLVTREW